ncbi:MAG: ferrous iron transporter B, partial [Candidatus Bathyarchaeota archaeon]|nr:ferrous iron transporter B [Candidatus Bathyarchaeota archaeon]
MRLKETAKKRLLIALAGNANVGKSVIFNYLTGLHQHIGNWPGKTVEKAEGTLHFKGYTIDVVDLPGIYSLSTYSIEEQISRKYIAVEKPDVVINVVDASVLERNLYFTLQLIELETPMVIALNQVDVAKKKGIKINVEKLERLLGIPVIPTIATKGVGIFKLLEKAVEAAEKKEKTKVLLKFGKEVEEKINKLAKMVANVHYHYPPRYTAIKLLEGDEEIEKEVEKLNPEVVAMAKKFSREVEELHGHGCSTVITAERYEIAGHIAREVQKLISPVKPRFEEYLHNFTTHKVAGYVTMVFLLLLTFYSIFTVGGYVSDFLNKLFYGLEAILYNFIGVETVGKLVWGIMEGVIAG